MSGQASEHETGAVTSPKDAPMFVPSAMRFRDRRDAGRQLASRLERLRGERPIVVGIPRGGVPVAAEIAGALDAPLDVAVVRKIGAPQNPEYAIGALAEGGVHVLSARAVRALGLSEEELERLIARVQDELEARLRRYRGDRMPVELQGRTAILVDDGLATGRSALAAVRSLRGRGAARVLLAVPVAAPESASALDEYADEVICVELPADLWAVGYWYEDFRPTSDKEVARLLAEHAPHESSPVSDVSGTDAPTVLTVAIPLDRELSLSADLTVPARARGLISFAHGSGSSRLSPRNSAVASELVEAGFATLLLDLLTPTEERDRANVFDIGLLSERLCAASASLRTRDDVGDLPLGFFGASTGAAAALNAAAELPEQVRAIVSRGGRPDLARGLATVRAPTLLIVGGADQAVLDLNHEARRELRCPSELVVVPGATHLFEEPGALEQVSRLAVDWFGRHLAPA